MNKTQIIGMMLVVIGVFTAFKDPKGVVSVGALIIGSFLLWNGWVANVNKQIDFAIFG